METVSHNLGSFNTIKVSDAFDTGTASLCLIILYHRWKQWGTSENICWCWRDLLEWWHISLWVEPWYLILLVFYTAQQTTFHSVQNSFIYIYWIEMIMCQELCISGLIKWDLYGYGNHWKPFFLEILVTYTWWHSFIFSWSSSRWRVCIHQQGIVHCLHDPVMHWYRLCHCMLGHESHLQGKKVREQQQNNIMLHTHIWTIGAVYQQLFVCVWEGWGWKPWDHFSPPVCPPSLLKNYKTADLCHECV